MECCINRNDEKSSSTSPNEPSKMVSDDRDKSASENIRSQRHTPMGDAITPDMICIRFCFHAFYRAILLCSRSSIHKSAVVVNFASFHRKASTNVRNKPGRGRSRSNGWGVAMGFATSSARAIFTRDAVPHEK